MSRTRTVYTRGGQPCEPYEVGEDFQSTRGLTAPATDLYMDGTRATDGTDISTRGKRRQYMKATGAADASDYAQAHAKARAQREQFYSGGNFDTSERKETIARAIHDLSRGKRKP